MAGAPTRLVVAFICGLLFGGGLAISGMLNPERIRGFLDIFGDWDPTLMFVLASAVGVAAVGNLIRSAMSTPLLDTAFHMPPRTEIDRRLLVGSALFGIGWAISGLCPGPALASIARDVSPIYVFALAMIAGILIHGDETSETAKPSDS
jgi:uncharacterized protein